MVGREYDGATDGTIDRLRLEIYRLRQRLIGGVEGVKAGRDLTKWAEVNDEWLRRTGYDSDEQAYLEKLDEQSS